ncbi:MAG: hypothetical protein J6R86_04405, partial [Lentisphaeria bacterium]|nr:hypothetical protein [Lentisphaeria bacterium]
MPCAFQMGLNLPCRPALIKTKELIDSGAIGKVFSVRGCCDVGYAFAHDVILRKFAGDPAGLILGKLTHDTDFIQYCLNTYAEVVCIASVCVAVAESVLYLLRDDSVVTVE